MNPQQQDLINKAQESLNAAKLLKANNYYDFAVSRAYYAMFYIAEAFLEGENQQFSSHAAVISAFGRHFAKSGQVPQDFHRLLIDAQSLRQISDYGKFQSISEQQAEQQVINAERFIDYALNNIN